MRGGHHGRQGQHHRRAALSLELQRHAAERGHREGLGRPQGACAEEAPQGQSQGKAPGSQGTKAADQRRQQAQPRQRRPLQRPAKEHRPAARRRGAKGKAPHRRRGEALLEQKEKAHQNGKEGGRPRGKPAVVPGELVAENAEAGFGQETCRHGLQPGVQPPEDGIAQAAPGVGGEGLKSQPQRRSQRQRQRQQHAAHGGARQYRPGSHGTQALEYLSHGRVAAHLVDPLPDGLHGSGTRLYSHACPSLRCFQCANSLPRRGGGRSREMGREMAPCQDGKNGIQ